MSGCMRAWELLLCSQFSQHIAVNVRGEAEASQGHGPLRLFRSTPLWEEQRLLVRADGILAQRPQGHCLPGSLGFQSQVPTVSAINNMKL